MSGGLPGTCWCTMSVGSLFLSCIKNFKQHLRFKQGYWHFGLWVELDALSESVPWKNVISRKGLIITALVNINQERIKFESESISPEIPEVYKNEGQQTNFHYWGLEVGTYTFFSFSTLGLSNWLRNQTNVFTFLYLASQMGEWGIYFILLGSQCHVLGNSWMEDWVHLKYCYWQK